MALSVSPVLFPDISRKEVVICDSHDQFSNRSLLRLRWSWAPGAQMPDGSCSRRAAPAQDLLQRKSFHHPS